ncbi:Gldg family protein [Temperatibacter marinus]|uniref:Gldg family protein n=1 Tax=Temperatibacter marinus TaxID=1456591 RepID=A0AA52EGM0_9PROT|nr:Gldg family protein [Temperatibacter marinus]WND03298.1 Gldg family protein [Temperatibacter marinus]
MFSKLKSYRLLFVMGIIMLVSWNIIADRLLGPYQIDLTEDRLYTLAKGSDRLLRDLEGEVTIEFFFSKKLAAPYADLLSYGKRIENMLRTFKACNPDKVTVIFRDPDPFSEAEDKAVAHGIQGIPMQSSENLYMGIRITNDVDGEKILPFLSSDREKFLEYDLIKAVTSLDAVDDKPQVALLTTLPMQFGAGGPQMAMQGRSQPYVIYTQMREAFRLVDLNKDFKTLPEDLDILMLVQPPQLTSEQEALIHDYIQKGGKTLIFADPHAEAVNPRATTPTAASLKTLLLPYGLQIQDKKIIGDLGLAQKVSMGGYGPDNIKDYLFWLNVTDAHLDKQDIVTSSIDNIALASSGALELLPERTTDITPLIWSSENAMLYDSSKAVGMPDPDSLLRELSPSDESYVIAARISNKSEDSESALQLFVMADSDLFDDRFWVQVQNLMGQQIIVPSAGNGSFIIGLLDHMTGNDALLSLRARGISQRPFSKVDEIRRKAEARYQQQEQLLEAKMQETEARIQQLEAIKPKAGSLVMNDAQQQELAQFKTELLEIRKELRTVKRNLRREIETLKFWLMGINIFLIPFLLAGIGLIVLMRRRGQSNRRGRA